MLSHRGEPIPEAPFAINLIRRLIADGQLPLRLRDGLTVEAFEHTTLLQSEQDALEQVIAGRSHDDTPLYSPGPIRRTRITLGVASSGNSAVDLVAYFRQDTERPIVLTTCRRGGNSEQLNALAQKVARASSYVHMSCEAQPVRAGEPSKPSLRAGRSKTWPSEGIGP